MSGRIWWRGCGAAIWGSWAPWPPRLRGGRWRCAARADPTEALAARRGAVGWLIAHAGSARGLIFARNRAERGGSRLAGGGVCRITRFKAGVTWSQAR